MRKTTIRLRIIIFTVLATMFAFVQLEAQTTYRFIGDQNQFIPLYYNNLAYWQNGLYPGHTIISGDEVNIQSGNYISTVTLNDTMLTVQSGGVLSINSGAKLNIQDGTVSSGIENNGTISGPTNAILYLLTTSTSLVNRGLVNIGYLYTGNVTNDTNGTITVTNHLNCQYGKLTNAGALNITGSLNQYNSGKIDNSGTINVYGSWSMDYNNSDSYVKYGDGIAIFKNGSSWTNQFNRNFNDFQVDSGVSVRMRSNPTMTGDYTNKYSSTFWLGDGNSGGDPSVTMTGSYTNQGNLIADVRGTSAGEFADFTIAGTATLGGTLTINSVNGYSPTAAETVAIIHAGSLADTFTNVVFPPGWIGSIAYNSPSAGEVSITFEPCTSPVIVTEPTNYTDTPGSNASFIVAATGAHVAYQWQVNMGWGFENITDGGVYSGANTDTLNITAAPATLDGYEYFCVVTSWGGCDVNTTTATLSVPCTSPVIATSPSNQTITPGSNASFVVAATGAHLAYQWKVDLGWTTYDIVDGGEYSGANTDTLKITAAPASIDGYQYYCVVTSWGGCAVNSATATLFAPCYASTWTGAVNTDWYTPENWSCGIPQSVTAVTIPAVANQPETGYFNSVNMASITLDSDAVLTINYGATLNVHGILANNGTLTGEGGVVLNDTIAQVITGTGTVTSLELNNSMGATIAAGNNKLNITGLLLLTAGTLTTNGNLVLKSTSPTNTAVVGPVYGAINGNVTHERYLSAPANGSGGRSWRLLTSPLGNNNDTNNSIFYNWQNNGVNDGTGIELFSPSGTGATGNGLAQGGVNPSIRSFNYVTNTYVPVANTKTTMLFTGTRNNTFMAFVSGSYGSGNITSGSGITNADATGTLITGTQSYSFTSPNSTNIYYLMGNPYACPIDFDRIYNNAGTANINQKFWVIDPNLSNVGAYVTVTNILGSYVNSLGVQDQYIQTGQGFFVEGNNIGSASTIDIEEDDKEPYSIQTSMFRTNGGNLETFRVKLYKNINSTPKLLDGAVVASHQNGNNGIDGVDGLKFGNFNENIGILNSGKTLAIDARQLLDNNDTVKVSLSSMQQTTYQLVIEPGNMSASGLYATLIDNFTNTVTPVSLTANTFYSFTVTGAAGSTGTGRFSVVFNSITPLDLKFVNTNATKHGDKVDVQWTVASQDGIRTYDVERSSDAKSFSKMATVTAGTDTRYSIVDETPLNGNNYYRIKAIARSSDHGVYSNIVRVNMNATGAELNAYPNPVKDGHLQISVANLTKGSYTISLYNAVGQKAATKQLSYEGGSAVIEMNMASLANGIYLMHLANENGETIAEQKVVKQ